MIVKNSNDLQKEYENFLPFAENCQQLKDLGFTKNGLYPLQGQPPKFEKCKFTESISSECKYQNNIRNFSRIF